MNNSEFSDNFLKYWNKLLLQPEKDAKTVSDTQRKLTALTYNASLKLLDNHSVCHLLETQLNKYSDIVTTPIDDKIKKVLSEQNIQTANLKSNLTKINIKSIIKPLECSSDDNVICKRSETVSNNEFQQFVKAYSRSNTRDVDEFLPSISSKNSCNSESNSSTSAFSTATEEFRKQQLMKKNENGQYNRQQPKQQPSYHPLNSVGGSKKLLGMRRHVKSKFVSPLQMEKSDEQPKSEEWSEEIVDERLRSVDPKMVELIKSEIMDCSAPIDWNDIAGLDFAKTCIQEVVVWPMLRPDIFRGLRRPPKGILLFGPPGTGKTLIGKCVACQSRSTFFNISASSLTSKWMGDGEKMVRALFTVARCTQPAVIFIDEIDSLLTQRSDTEHECTRRIKTEFLIQLDGASTDCNERLLVIGATNRPQELDEAARRRFVKRLYIPLPDFKARFQLVKQLVAQEKHELSVLDFEEIAKLSEGYSGADIRHLCSEASLGPIRSIDLSNIEKIKVHEVRPLLMEDFIMAFGRVKSSVSSSDLHQYIAWDKTFGSGL